MKTSKQILPGVKAIGWIDCRKLQSNVALAAICRMPVIVLTEIHPVDFFDEPTCECSTSRENGGYKDSASLKFLCGEELPKHIPLGFVVTDVNDNSWLIGSKEAPLPNPSFTRRCAAPSRDNAGLLYEISHVAIKSMIPCQI